MFRLYPTIAAPGFLALESGSKESIEPPAGSLTPAMTGNAKAYLGPEKGHGRHGRQPRVPTARPARVVGSFEHAVLPMPPVKILYLITMSVSDIVLLEEG